MGDGCEFKCGRKIVDSKKTLPLIIDENIKLAMRTMGLRFCKRLPLLVAAQSAK
jgi:hypothetical protein